MFAGDSVHLELWDLQNKVADLTDSSHPDGNYSESIKVPKLPPGLYYVRAVSQRDTALWHQTRDPIVIYNSSTAVPEVSWMCYD